MPPGANSMSAITVEHVSKRFRQPDEARHTLKERALHPFRRAGSRRVRGAARRVVRGRARASSSASSGATASGKSTLLKCIAGIYRVDAGEICVHGRMSTFIELGVGFNPDLAARDNVDPQRDHARA